MILNYPAGEKKKMEKVTRKTALLLTVCALALVSGGVIAYLSVQKSADYEVSITVEGVMNIEMVDWSTIKLCYDSATPSTTFFDDLVDEASVRLVELPDTVENDLVGVAFMLKDDYNSPNIYLTVSEDLESDITINSITLYHAENKLWSEMDYYSLDNEINDNPSYQVSYTISLDTKTLIADEYVLDQWSQPYVGGDESNNGGFIYVLVDVEPADGSTYNPDPDVEESGSTSIQTLALTFEFRDA